MGGIERIDVDSNKSIENLKNFQIRSKCDFPPLDHNFTSLPTLKEINSKGNLGKQFYGKYGMVKWI